MSLYLTAMKSAVTFLVLCLIQMGLAGQHLSKRIYGLDDGLPHLEVHGAFEMYGQLYASPGQNLARWDGYSFDILPGDQSSIISYVNTAFPLKNGYIIRGGNTPLVYFDGTVGHLLENEIPQRKAIRYFPIDSAMFKVDSLYNVLRFSEDQLAFVTDTTFDVRKLIPSQKDFWSTYFINDSLVSHIFKDPITANQTFTIYNLFTQDGQSTTATLGESGTPSYTNNKVYYVSPQGDLACLDEEGEYIFNTDEIRSYGKLASVSKMAGDKNNKILFWARIKNEGRKNLLISIEGKNLEIIGSISESSLYLPYVDRMGNIWHGSHQGLVRVNPNITYFDGADPNMVASLHTIVEDPAGKIWIGGYGSGLTSYADYKFTKNKTAPKNITHFLPGAQKLKDHSILFNVEQIPRFMRLKDNKWSLLSLVANGQSSNSAGYYIDTLKSGQLAIGLQKIGLGLVQNMSGKTIQVNTIGKEKGVQLQNVLHFTQDRKDRIWMGRSSRGVAIYDMSLDTAWSYLRSGTDPNSFGAISLTHDDYGTLWLGTNKGLYHLPNAHLFDPYSDDLFAMTKPIILPDGNESLVTALKIVKGYLVIGNQSAVSFLDLNKYYNNPDTPWIYQLMYGEDINGGGTEQNAILFDSQDYLWIGSQTGASRIDFSNLPFDTATSQIVLKSVQTGKGTLSTNGSISLPIDSRNLELTFGLKENPNLMKNTFFDYALVSNKGDTIIEKKFDQDGHLILNYLSPASYHLNITAKKHGQVIDQKTVRIYAPRSLGEHPLTWICLTALSIIAFSGFYIFRNKQKRKLAEQNLELAQLKNEKDHLQIQAIISTFNPHFINNSLHWAQSRYRKDHAFTGMIESLSQNIEYIFLNTSEGKAVHTIGDELRLVNNYTNIQLLRFDNSFKIIWPDQDISARLTEYPILLMQIQIHVENAIEHGLANRIKGSFVKIEIREDKTHVLIAITDDGGGRPLSKKIESKGTQRGTKMLSELHNIYNTNPGNKTKIMTTYLDNIFENQYGTRVEISIPKGYKYEL